MKANLLLNLIALLLTVITVLAPTGSRSAELPEPLQGQPEWSATDQEHVFFPFIISGIPNQPFRKVSAGGEHTCALELDGSMVCWGSRFQNIGPDGRFIQVSAGGNHACGLRADGSVACMVITPAGCKPAVRLCVGDITTLANLHLRRISFHKLAQAQRMPADYGWMEAQPVGEAISGTNLRLQLAVLSSLMPVSVTLAG